MPPKRQPRKKNKPMPRKRVGSKNARVARVGRRAQRIPRPISSAPAARAAEYCSSLIRGSLTSDPATPCATSRAFQEIIVTATIRPVASADGDIVVVFNPHLMFTDFFSMVSQYGISGSPSAVGAVCQIPSCYNATGANSFVPIFSTTGESAPAGLASGGAAFERHIQNANPSNSSTGLSGDVRFLGGHVHFSTFETTLNTGGQLLYIHNPQDRSLLGVNYFEGTATPASVVCIGFDSITKSAATATRTATALTQVTPAPITTTILPHTTEFEYISASADAPDATALSFTGAQLRGGITGSWMDQVDAMIPSIPGEVRHQGFTHAFVYVPAVSKAPAASGNCEFQFEMHYHVNVNTQPNNTSLTMSAATSVKTQGVSDARSAAAMQATIDGLKQARIDNPQAAFHRATDTNLPTASVLPSLLGTVAKVAPDIATTIANMLPPGLPRTILGAAAQLGRNLLG
jgi:hypothetical protein